MIHRLVRALVIALLLTSTITASAQAPDARKAEAIARFDAGIAAFDRSDWSAALTEFQASRALVPSKGNTKNAAACLKQLGRTDDAIAMYESLLTGFPDLSEVDRGSAEKELVALKKQSSSEGARSHFELGLSHFDHEEWDAALAEFSKSRELLPSKSNTKNAAICLRKVHRNDEALAMFEALLREFRDLSPTDRAIAEREIEDLRRSLATVTIEGAPAGASVSVDGRDRGRTPLAAPIRLSTGQHSIRVTLEGALPFETQVLLSDRQNALVRVQLARLTQAGRLRVATVDGTRIEILVDGGAVGSTPWEGALTPGAHTVQLRGEGTTGTEPRRVVVKLDDVTVLELAPEPMRGIVRIEVKPPRAMIEIDGVAVAAGTWDGRLRSGPHRIEAKLDGYLSKVADRVLVDESRALVSLELQRDAALFGPPARRGVAVELDASALLGAIYGGDLANGCKAGCSSSVPLGLSGVLRATYQFQSGFGLGVHAGYLSLSRTYVGRAALATPVGKTAQNGALDDKLSLTGVVAGADGQLSIGEKWPATLRFGAGVLLGGITDTRSGAFTDSKAASYAVNTRTRPSATYLYVAPEVRIGRRFGPHVAVDVGVQAVIMVGLKTPKWDPLSTVSGPDGFVQFPADSLTGGVMLSFVPGIGAKYEF